MKEYEAFLKNLGVTNAIAQDIVEIATVLIVIAIILAIIKFILSFAIKKGADESVKPLLYSLFSYALYIVGLLMILHILGVNTAGIVTVIGAASLAIGLALKDTLGNIASGILLLFLHPFRASDYIECGSLKGKIVGVGLFNTTLIFTSLLRIACCGALRLSTLAAIRAAVLIWLLALIMRILLKRR